MYTVDVCVDVHTQGKSVSVIAPNSRRTMNIPMKSRDVLLAKVALIGILSLVAELSAQGQSPESQSGQWRIAGQDLAGC